MAQLRRRGNLDWMTCRIGCIQPFEAVNEGIDGLELPIWPPLDAIRPAALLEDGDPDPHGSRRLCYRETKEGNDVLSVDLLIKRLQISAKLQSQVKLSLCSAGHFFLKLAALTLAARPCRRTRSLAEKGQAAQKRPRGPGPQLILGPSPNRALIAKLGRSAQTSTCWMRPSMIGRPELQMSITKVGYDPVNVQQTMTLLTHDVSSCSVLPASSVQPALSKT